MTSEQILSEAKACYDYMLTLRRDIHAHPELSGKEFRTQALILRELEAMGIEAGPCADTGVLGLLRGGKDGKTIGLRADIDALPITEDSGVDFQSQNEGVMHACGHDLHAAALLGAAKILSAHRDELQGNVKFFFQPAEEAVGGAQRMVDEGCLENPHVDAVFGGHNNIETEAGRYALKYGQSYAASNPFTVTIHGKGCHGAYPGSGIDAVAIGCQIVTALQTLVSRRVYATDSVVVTVGAFHAGTAGNIICEEAHLKGIIRTLGPEMRAKVTGLFRETVTGIAEAMGGSAEVRISESYPGIVNTDDMSDLVYRSMCKLVGRENAVIKRIPDMGTEDFGAFFMPDRPGCYCDFGFGDGGKECCFPVHGPHFRVKEEGLFYAAALHTQVVFDFLSQP